MSTVNTATLQADTIVAKNGDATKEVSIPSLINRMAFSLGDFSAASGTVVVNKTLNVSSIIRISSGLFEVNFINKATSDNFSVSGSASGGVYLFSQVATRSDTNFRFNTVRSNTVATVDPVIIDFQVFDVA